MVIFAPSARAQMGPWSYTVYATGEYDTDETAFALAGLSLAPKRLGIVPVLGVQGHFLRYALPTGDVDSKGVQPFVGLQNNFGTGLLGARVGYQFESNSALLTAPSSIAAGEGVVVTGQLESWGTGTGIGGQALATYNFGSETMWGRGRLDMPLTQLNPGAIRLGVEAAYLNVGEGVGFESASVGPVLMWQTGRGVNLGFAVGKRLMDSDATYFRVDLALFPTK
jgi:hypothetical protein